MGNLKRQFEHFLLELFVACTLIKHQEYIMKNMIENIMISDASVH